MRVRQSTRLITNPIPYTQRQYHVSRTQQCHLRVKLGSQQLYTQCYNAEVHY